MQNDRSARLQKTKIPARGLKLHDPEFDTPSSPMPSKNQNPREGIETNPSSSFLTMYQGTLQKTKIPARGLKLMEYKPLSSFDERNLQKTKIPARGLKLYSCRYFQVYT